MDGQEPPFPEDREVAALRVPPHSIEAEQAVLGGLLLDNMVFERVSDVLSPDDFYRFDHRLIWNQVSRLIDRNQPADVVTVYEALQSDGQADELPGGMEYLNSLAMETPSAANARRYAEIVRDRAILRQLISTSDEIAASAFETKGRETAQLLDEAEAKMLSISEQRNRRRDDDKRLDQERFGREAGAKLAEPEKHGLLDDARKTRIIEAAIARAKQRRQARVPNANAPEKSP